MKKNIDILSQFILPREIIPISIVLANFINFLIGFIVIVPIFIVFNTEITKYLFLLPLIMFLHFIFTLGISILFSIVNVYFRDLSQLLNVGVMFLFWMTPIFYSLETIPENFRWIIIANPNTCYVVIYRSLLYDASSGNINMWLLAAGFALISIIGGYSLFVRKEVNILKYI
jgi:ABC-2 type transport system permease protein